MTEVELKSLLQSHGMVFNGGHVIIDLGATGTLALDEKYFLQPSAKACAELTATIERELGIKIETFDVKDPKYGAKINGNHVRYFGRIHHRTEVTCCPVRRRNYYKYIRMEAPMSAVSDDSWEKMAQWLACVVVTLTVIVALAYLSGGGSVAASVPIFIAVAAACMAVMSTVNQSEKEAASISTPVER